MSDVRHPLRHLVVCAHPSPAGFGHAVLDTYVRTVHDHGQQATVRDLYALGFDPVLRFEEQPRGGQWTPSPDVATELAFVTDADIVVLIYPIWYGLPPAILKGYVERVLGANYSWRQLHDREGQAALAGKPLLSFSTSGLPLAWLEDQSQVLALREIFDVYLWRGFGMKQSEHVMLDGIVPNMNRVNTEAHLRRVHDTAARTCTLLAGGQSSQPSFEA